MPIKKDIDVFLNKLIEFKKASSRLSALDDFSKLLTERQKVFESFDENLSSEFKDIAKSFEDLLEKFLFVTLVNRRKIDAINSLITFSIDSKNPISLAQGIRALLEHACVLSMVAKEIEKLKIGLDGQNEFTKIKSVLDRSERFIYRCYFGKSSKVVADKSKQALHINDGLELLKNKLSSINDDYDYLCEFVHPNHGSNLLVSISEVEKYLTAIESNFDRDEVKKMIEIGKKILEAIEKEEAYVYSMVGVLSTIANRFIAKGAKLSNIFAAKKAVMKGDGKSKETSLFVSNGRDAAEEIELIYRYFEKNKYQILGRKVDSLSGDFIYDLFDTNKGKVWVKVSFAAGSDG